MVDRASLGIRDVDLMGNLKCALSQPAALSGFGSGLSNAVCRVAKGGDENEMVDRLGCHWTERRLLVDLCGGRQDGLKQESVAKRSSKWNGSRVISDSIWLCTRACRVRGRLRQIHLAHQPRVSYRSS